MAKGDYTAPQWQESGGITITHSQDGAMGVVDASPEFARWLLDVGGYLKEGVIVDGKVVCAGFDMENPDTWVLLLK